MGEISHVSSATYNALNVMTEQGMLKPKSREKYFGIISLVVVLSLSTEC